MIENNDITKFPTPDYPGEFRVSMFSARTFGLYQVTEVDKWFKRCIEDFPKYPVLGKGEPWTHKEYEAWFDKWLGQFRNKGDKNEDRS